MPSVLVVDDTHVDRCLIQGILEKETSTTVSLADSASEALSLMEKGAPDVVITDLQMPEVDGLELVNLMRLRFPDVPVVLTTAYGSEELAVQALQQGVASYVPKLQLANRLLPTVQHVLELSHADRQYERFSRCLEDAKCRFSLEGDPELIGPLVDLVRGMAGSVGLCDPSEQLRLATTLTGLLSYAMLRGNFELSAEELEALEMNQAEAMDTLERRRGESPYRERRLRVEIQLSSEEGLFRVRQEGVPFQSDAVLGTSSEDTVGAKANRGLVLMRTFADEIAIEDSDMCIAMVRRRNRT
jgi:CheY-like chemotaxis protein